MLSAAELDSSKQYIQLSDGTWIVAHQLPIADGFFTCDVGMQIARNANDTTATIEQLFAANTRLRKTHVGVIRPLTGPVQQMVRQRLLRVHALWLLLLLTHTYTKQTHTHTPKKLILYSLFANSSTGAAFIYETPRLRLMPTA